MAGSYEHLLHGWSMIENMGDANEAVEELLWLVQHGIGEQEAKRLLDSKFYPMKLGEMAHDADYRAVQRMMQD